ncbi:MAG: radical SAM protein, partial [Acutalibacteraceae bacterium]|nr:radical SAM protein [Acutalibacteraceae bacterium]
LSADETLMLIEAVRNSFDLSHCREYTFESGRADVISAEKLEVLKNNGVGRISINPQTFDDSVLEIIGRKHTASEALSAYNLAKSIGFDSINMDLIAGLPGDTIDGFKSSVDTAIANRPENITVHSLALKAQVHLLPRKIRFCRKMIRPQR